MVFVNNQFFLDSNTRFIQFNDLEKIYPNWGIEISTGYGILSTTKIEKSKPVEKRGRKAEGLKCKPWRPGC
jgi:hypothetical protein